MIKFNNIIKEARGKHHYNWMQFFGEWRNKEDILVEYFDACSSFITGNNRSPMEDFISKDKELISELQSWVFPNKAKLYRGFWQHPGIINEEIEKIIQYDVGQTIRFQPAGHYKLQHWTTSLKEAQKFAGKQDTGKMKGSVVEAYIKKDMMIFSYAHLKPMIEWLKDREHIVLSPNEVSVLDFKHEKEIIVYHDKPMNAKIMWKTYGND